MVYCHEVCQFSRLQRNMCQHLGDAPFYYLAKHNLFFFPSADSPRLSCLVPFSYRTLSVLSESYSAADLCQGLWCRSPQWHPVSIALDRCVNQDRLPLGPPCVISPSRGEAGELRAGACLLEVTLMPFLLPVFPARLLLFF